jgi:GNAT superfamily N-acetyltransferase
VKNTRIKTDKHDPKEATMLSAGAEDTGRLARIIRRSFADVAARFRLTPENCPKHPSNCTRQWMERDLARGVQYVILTIGDADVGCVGVEQASETTCYMERLAVLPDHRGNGYGTRLARWALHRAGDLGAANVGIGIIAADAGLKRFYESLGFEAGETKTFAHLPFEVAFMSISL